MIPYVIDQKKRQEYFLFLIFFTVISFALGYFFGFQSGQSDLGLSAIQSSAEQSIESSIEEGEQLKTISTDNKAEKQNIKNIIKVKDKTIVKDNAKKVVKNIRKIKDNKKNLNKTTKDKPKTTSASASASISKSKSKRIAKKKTVNLKSDSKRKASKKITISKSNIQKSEPVKILTPVAKVPVDKSESQDSVPEKAKNSVEQDTTPIISGEQSPEQSNEKTLKSYSVQVGMFASKPNAEKLVNALTVSGFEVYLSDFISSTGRKKYNVRLGPYAKRTLAKDSMALYKQSHATPAYIVINK